MTNKGWGAHCRTEEAKYSKEVRDDMSRLEGLLAATKRDYELLKMEHEKMIASNEQAAPIAKLVRLNLIPKSLLIMSQGSLRQQWTSFRRPYSNLRQRSTATRHELTRQSRAMSKLVIPTTLKHNSNHFSQCGPILL